MSYRHFLDETGITWQVWEVRPARVERRMRERRMAQLPFTGPDRRGSGSERRQRAEQRIFLGEDLAHGWLAFHAGAEKRRYAPIPDGWSEMTTEQLGRLCREATRVQPGGPSFGPRGSGGGSLEPNEANRGGRQQARLGEPGSASNRRPRSA